MAQTPSAESWAQLRLARRLHTMLQTDSGLTEATVIWLDSMNLHVLSQVRLPLDRGLRARLDLGPVGDPVDLQITAFQVTEGRTSGQGRGWLHRARWIALTMPEGDRITRLMPRLNPQLALDSMISSVSRSRGTSSTVSRMPSESRSQAGQRQQDHSQGSQSRSVAGRAGSGSSSSRSRQTSRERRSGAPDSAAGRRERRGTVPAVVAAGRPLNLLVDAGNPKALSRALRLGPGSLRLAVRLDRAVDAATSVVLVFKLPDGSYLQRPAQVLRVAGERWLLAADDVPETDLAVLRRAVPEGKEGH